MNKVYRDMSFGILIAVAIFVAGFLLSAFINHPPTKDTDAATWAGAMGAFCAFAGTIWIATRETNRRNAEAQKLAQLTAIRFSAVTAEATIKNRAIRDAVIANLNTDNNFKNIKGYEMMLRSCPAWTMEDLVPLIVLPNTCAHSLASAKQGIDVLISLFVSHNSSTYAPEGKTPNDFFVDAVGNLNYTIAHLEIAHRCCQDAIKSLQ